MIDLTPLVMGVTGCDGWCVKGDSFAAVRLNANTSSARQRFTLAHELSHIILGTTPDVSNISGISFIGNNEEGVINSVASEMLLPQEQLAARIKEIPVPRTTIDAIAQDARVSHAMVARRIATTAKSIGLAMGVLVGVANGRVRWTVPNMAISSSHAIRLYSLARQGAKFAEGDDRTSFILFETPYMDYLLVQFILA